MKKTFWIALLITALIFPSRPVRAEDLPPQARIQGFIGHPQTYNLSCESRSAADWAAYFGVSASETDIMTNLGSSDDPEVGFVGAWNGAWGSIPPYSYGVHAAAIARVLRDYGLPAEGKKGITWDEARAQIAAGKPVIVWLIGGVWPGTPVEYTASDGQTTTVAAYEHSMTLIGYTESIVYLMDSASALTYTPSIDAFLTSWSVLGNQGVIYTGDRPVQSPAADVPAEDVQRPDLEDGVHYEVRQGDFLMGVARDFGLAWEDLAAANQIDYPYTIFAGQELVIPGVETETPTQAETAPGGETAAETPVPATPTDRPGEYTVQAGDHLMAIARQYGVAWQAIVAENHLDYPYFLYPDQVLVLPTDGLTQTPTVEETGEASTSTPVDTPTPVPTEPPTPTPTPAPQETYTVQSGDFLRELADEFGVDWEDLAEANHLSWPYVIHPGDELIIPGN